MSESELQREPDPAEAPAEVPTQEQAEQAEDHDPASVVIPEGDEQHIEEEEQ
jgi:hypothetical protein